MKPVAIIRKRSFIFYLFILGTTLLYNCQSDKNIKEHLDKLPNIVLILADDMGYGDVQSYNPSSKIPTPNLNTLAEEGMRFEDAHTNSSVCTPTRYGILTGRYCWRTRLKSGVLFPPNDKPLIKRNYSGSWTSHDLR